MSRSEDTAAEAGGGQAPRAVPVGSGASFVEGVVPEPPRPRSSWSLRRRVTSLLAVVAVVLVTAVSVISLAAFNARDSLNLQVDSLTPAVTAVEQTRSSYLAQDHALLSYVVSQDRELLEPYLENKVTLLDNRAELTRLAEEYPIVKDGVEELLSAGQRWTDDYAEPVLEQVSNGETPSEEEMQRGRVLFLELSRASDSVAQQLQGDILDARSGLTMATQQVVALLVLIGLVVVFLSVFLWVMLQQWMLRPLEELAWHMRQVSEGYYTHRITLQGPPEIVRLGRDVDAMRERIVHDLDEVGSARRKLQEQSALLEAQTEELRRSNLELEQFAYVASHDLQEPLRKVASFCQLLQRRYQGQLDERADSYIDFAVEGAKRMQTLINDLLAFSRVGRTRNFAPVDLDTALRDALSSLSTRLEEDDARVTSDPLPTIQGDRTLLTQVFFNLVGNAVKFRAEEDPRVRISARRQGDEWVFCCADNGIGIEPQYAERVFVIFQRLHTRDKYTGTGIGLAMCKKIVEFHGGRIWLDTGDGGGAPVSGGGGTRICWSLPADPDDEDAASAAGAEGAERGGEDAPEAGSADPVPAATGDRGLQA
ncbi:ATP-binding protein [Nocardiopsis sp. CNT312]|uniref:sensor histidine kinase n=1 Tax=Nocardiopsis sp. CNT312 TaxID=1137268 RepID=UPI0004B7A8E7|nr:ATP-binding protein [Nocardiopsis sp. CNT312]